MLSRLLIVAYASLSIFVNYCFETEAFSGPSLQRKLTTSRPQRLSIHPRTLNASVKDSETNKRSEAFTDLNRIKFMYNQLKGNIQEYELRAFAAENRTRQLEKKLREYESQVGEESERKASEKVASMKASQKKKFEKWDKKYQKLKKELDEAVETSQKSQADLLDAQTKMKDIEKKLNDEMESLRLSFKKDYDSMKTKLESKINDLKFDYDEKLGNATNENSELRKTLDQTVNDLTNKLISTERNHKSMLTSLRSELTGTKEVAQALDRKIQNLEKERSSIRSLARLQMALLKERVKKRYKSIKGKK